jgi:hypothetical protein
MLFYAVVILLIGLFLLSIVLTVGVYLRQTWREHRDRQRQTTRSRRADDSSS